jgi:hypothetical protein
MDGSVILVGPLEPLFFAGGELAGDELGNADGGERLDLLTYCRLVSDDGDVRISVVMSSKVDARLPA